MNNPLSEAAVLPFQILESLAVPCAYERSFKLVEPHILANRYLLAFDTTQLTKTQILATCTEMNMPEILFQRFKAELNSANKVALSFEADIHGGGLFKIYLEFRDQMQKSMRCHPHSSDPQLLYTGFKWQYDDPEKNVITLYHHLPEMTKSRIRKKLNAQYGEFDETSCLATVNRIIDLALTRLPDNSLMYVEVSEAGNPRKSFDLNLYPAGLTIKDIAEQLQEACARMNVDKQQFSHLMSIISEKVFGHVSAGTGRDGKEYFSIYYEN